MQTAAQIHHVVELVDEFRGERIRIATGGPGNPILVTDPDGRRGADGADAVSGLIRSIDRAA